jgi:DNA-binding NtrC family response regulator
VAGVAILHVEDQPALRELVRQALEIFGFNVVSVEGVRAAKVALAERADLAGALLDIRLRDGSGLEIYEWIAANHAALLGRVAFVTGSGEAESFGPLTATGCAVLPKPFDIVDLKRLASEWERADDSASP